MELSRWEKDWRFLTFILSLLSSSPRQTKAKCILTSSLTDKVEFWAGFRKSRSMNTEHCLRIKPSFHLFSFSLHHPPLAQLLLVLSGLDHSFPLCASTLSSPTPPSLAPPPPSSVWPALDQGQAGATYLFSSGVESLRRRRGAMGWWTPPTAHRPTQETLLTGGTMQAWPKVSLQLVVVGSTAKDGRCVAFSSAKYKDSFWTFKKKCSGLDFIYKYTPRLKSLHF